jgi:BirA family biotin operon repressor/biotin-[acetyl-CoA-carboxylase] ligase
MRGFGLVREKWLSRTYPVGAAIRANAGGQLITRGFVGLDVDGALLLLTSEGRQRIVAGEIIVQGPLE